MQSKNFSDRKSWQPLDRTAIAAVVILTFAIGLLLWNGDTTAPQVREFSWQGQQIQANDSAFVLTFNRPMDRTSVEKNLKIAPELPGRISWAGRRMAYTLNGPAIYGKSYQLNLQGAFDRFASEVGKRIPIQPFVGNFYTPEPALAYIGVKGDENGRIVMYNLAKQSKQILTSSDLTVTDFRVYPDRKKILFAATNQTNGVLDILEQKLYTVTTGIGDGTVAGKVDKILDSIDYQNFKFDLSADGKTVVVQRLSRTVPGLYGLWVVKSGKPPQPLENQPGGDFIIAPDSASVAIAQGEGVAILPLEPQAKPLDFLPKFGTVLSFSQDGTQAAMVKFNKDYTRSLYRVTNQGIQQELVKTSGSILSAVFDPQKKTLYCLLTDAQQDRGLFQEEPFLAAIDLATAKLTRLLDLPGQRNLQFSLAPDASYLLFNKADRDRTVEENAPSAPTTQSGDTRSDSSGSIDGTDRSNSDARRRSQTTAPQPDKQHLYLFPLHAALPQSQAESLPLFGLHPQWLP